MATKRYNRQSFHAEVNGNAYSFYAHTTDTRCGFCHTIETYRNYLIFCSDTKESYYNRTWERFDYETVLRRAIEKCPKADRQELYDILIERKAQKEHEEAENFVKSFETAFNSLTDENKERVANVVGHIETEEQAQAALAITRLAALTQACV